jgi:hypothetical protein
MSATRFGSGAYAKGAVPADSAIALAAAHGITSRVAATWYEHLLRAPRVLVPIQVDALVVRTEGGVWAKCEMQVPAADAADPTPRRELMPAPFSDLETSRPRGVYLHWALPDALTHGAAATAGGPTVFPPIPDRWTVLRMSPGKGYRRAVTGWVLETGGATPVVTPLDKWVEPGVPPAGLKGALTSFGHGDPSWHAYYDNLVNRLGFYDDLHDVANGPLGYLVCGWFSQAGDDPLGDPKVRSLTDFDRLCRTLRWELAGGELEEAVHHTNKYVLAAGRLGLQSTVTKGADARESAIPAPPAVEPAAPQSAPLGGDGETYVSDGTWWPQGTVYHGCAVGIGWPTDAFPGNEDCSLSTETGGPPAARSLTVALGITIPEALGVVVSHADGDPEEARLLEAFHFGILRELDKADGRAHLDAVLHAAGFGSLSGGPESVERIWQPQTPFNPPLPTTPGTPGPGVFARPSTSRPGALDKVLETHLVAREDGLLQTRTFTSPREMSESVLLNGGLASVISAVNPATPPAATPGRWIDVKRTQPRLFHPFDPVVLVQGGARSFKHGGDGRFSADGSLICRLSGFCVTDISVFEGREGPGRLAARGEDLLERGVENGSTPPDCEDLLREAALLDPGSVVAAATVGQAVARGVAAAELHSAGADATVSASATRFMVEQTAWWATRDQRIDSAPLVARSGISGMLPSPIAITPPQRPWNPLHLDYQVELMLNSIGDWTLGEVDFAPAAGVSPPALGADGVVVVSGRALLTGGAAQSVADAARVALATVSSAAGSGEIAVNERERYFSATAEVLLSNIDQTLINAIGDGGGNGGGGGDGQPLTPEERDSLTTLIGLLDGMDVLSGGLDGIHDQLRAHVPKIAPKTGGTAAAPPPPEGFTPLRAGFMRVRRLRLVDGFGQFVDLAGSGDKSPVDPQQLLLSETVSVPGSPGAAALAPRFTAPSRLWFRWVDAESGSPDTPINPACGFVMPDHLDGSLEFFDATGAGLGMVRPDGNGGTVWEEAPGVPSTVGQSPVRAIPNLWLAGVAQGLLDWGVVDASRGQETDDALSGLLRVIDSTLWSVDPFGHTGDEHLAMLVGHPVVVMRAVLRLEVQDPADPAENAYTPVPVRLGALTHWQDGLLGYFVNDDYQTLYCADAAAAMAREVGPNRGFLQAIGDVPGFYAEFASDLPEGATAGSTPVTHPFVDASGVLWVRPNQEVRLTMLVEPHGVVNASTGVLPRKDIGMRREWIAGALAKLAPTFRFGPVLVDPKTVRMPVASDIAGTWSWDHRKDVSSWVEEDITAATGEALLHDDPVAGSEGWLRLSPPPPAAAATGGTSTATPGGAGGGGT